MKHIIRYYTYERETANTEFHSGLQIFVPKDMVERISNSQLIQLDSRLEPLLEEDPLIRSFAI